MEARTHTKKRAIEFFMRDSEYEHCTKKCGQLSLDEAKDFLLDGGCFLLMRYLVQQQFIGSFEMLSMLVTGMSENLIITLSFSVYRTATIFFFVSKAKRVVPYSTSAENPKFSSTNVCAPSTKCVAFSRVPFTSRTCPYRCFSNRATWCGTPGKTVCTCCTSIPCKTWPICWSSSPATPPRSTRDGGWTPI